MRPGDFTTAGHFIVLTKTENGQIKVNDPNSRSRSKIWNYETLEKQIKNLGHSAKADAHFFSSLTSPQNTSLRRKAQFLKYYL